MQIGISTGELIHQKASGICFGPFDNAEYGTEKTVYSCYNQRKNNMEDCGMSFVGLMRSDEGIVAFADSKGTINGAAGLYSETREVKKLFMHKNFIMVVAGSNTYRTDWSIRPIEELIGEKLEGFKGTPYDFVRLLNEELKQNWENNQSDYYLMFGCKSLPDYAFRERHKYQFIVFHRTAEGLIDVHIHPNHFCVTNTGPSFIPPLFCGSDWSLERMKEEANDALDFVIRMGDKYLPYNPVCGHKVIQTFQAS